MATLFQATGGTIGTLVPTTSWAAPNGLFPTTDRNDSSAYSWASSTSTVTLPASGLADGYLFLWGFETEDSSNGRYNPTGRMVQASGTGTFAAASTGGYSRDSSEDRAYVSGWAFVDNPSASSTYQFQWKRDSDLPNTSDGTVRSFIQAIPFYYADIGIYTSTTAGNYGGTTPNLMTGFSGTDGTNITITSNQVSVTGDNRRYLVLGGAYQENVSGGSRTQRWYGLEIDGSFDHAAKGCMYYRNTTNDTGGESFIRLIETVTATRTIEVNGYRGDGVAAGQGGADVDGTGTESNASHALVVIELNDSAEVFSSTNDTNTQEFAVTGPVDVNIASTGGIEFNDSASFTRSTDTAVDCTVAMDVLAFANVSHAREASSIGSGQRWTVHGEFTIDGTEQTGVGFHGNYNRGNQSTQDCHGSSTNQAGFFAVTAGQDVGVSNQELAGTEGGAGDIETQADWVGFGLINLDTLEDSGVSHTALPGAGSATLTGQAPSIEFSYTQPIPAGSLVFTGYAPTVTLGSVIDVPAGSLTLTGNPPPTVLQPSSYGLQLQGYAPTVDVVTSSIEIPAGSLAITGYAPTVAVTDNVVVNVPAGSLTVTGHAPTVLTGDNRVAAPDVGTLVITGYVPPLIWTDNHVRAPPTGSGTFTGYAPLAIAGDVKIAQPGTGSLSFTGHTPTVSVTDNHVAAPPSGSLAATGGAPTARVGATVDVPLGSLILTGYPPPTVLQPSSYGLQLVGYAPTVITEGAEVITPPAGSLTLTGHAPTVITTGNVTAEPATGALTLSGAAPTISYSWVVEPPVGSLVTSGAAPTVTVGDDRVITVPAGSLTATGYAPTVTVLGGITVQPGTGSLTLTGIAPFMDVTGDGVIPIPTGALTAEGYSPPTVLQPSQFGLQFVGYAPTIVVEGAAGVINVPTGALTITGEVPALEIFLTNPPGSMQLDGYAPTVTVTGDVFIPVPAGGITTQGYEPVVVIPQDAQSAQPGAGSVTITGHQPSLYFGKYEPLFGQLFIDGYEPTLSYQWVAQPDTGQLFLNEWAPTVVVGKKAEPPTGSLTITGHSPKVIGGEVKADPPSGGHFIPGLAGVRAGKKRPWEAKREAEAVIEDVIREVLEDDTKPIKRVSRKRKSRIIELATDEIQRQSILLGDLYALERAVALLSKALLKRRLDTLPTEGPRPLIIPDTPLVLPDPSDQVLAKLAFDVLSQEFQDPDPAEIELAETLLSEPDDEFVLIAQLLMNL